MTTLMRFLKSTILNKIVMAATGVILVLFLLGHMVGNLQMYSGQEKMNTYAQFLQGLGGLLWFVRAFLLTCFLLHTILSLRLKLLNLSARPDRYVRKQWIKASLISRTMLWTGFFVVSFLTYHILHFTLGSTNPMHYGILDATGRHDVYSMVILGYQNVYISGVYIIAVILLGFHLSHAISSMFQTLGVNHPKYNGCINSLGPVLSIIIVIGFLSIPIGVLFGFIELPAGVIGL